MPSANQNLRRSDLSSTELLKSFPVDSDLTPRERLVLAGIIEGRTNKEIARALNISPRTVEFHRANLVRKYAARNTAELVRKVLGQ